MLQNRLLAVRRRSVLSPGKRTSTRLVSEGKIADDAHRPVLYISKYKTVNYHMQCALAQAGYVKIKFINGEVPIEFDEFINIIRNYLKCR